MQWIDVDEITGSPNDTFNKVTDLEDIWIQVWDGESAEFSDDGYIFEGNGYHWEDCFMSSSAPLDVTEFCEDHEWKVNMIFDKEEILRVRNAARERFGKGG